MQLPTRVATRPVDIDPAVVAESDLTMHTFQAAMRDRCCPTGDVGWIVYIPIDAPDLAKAMAIATGIGRRVASRFPAADVGMTEVSIAAHPSVRHRVFCDARLADGAACRLRPGHATGHADYEQ
jgi:hypothetical protein